MRNAMSGKKLILLLGTMVLAAAPGLSQVATPSMDPTQPVVMPSAAGWREKPSVGVSYQDGSGDRDLFSDQVYQFDKTGMDGNLAFKAGNVFVELYAAQTKTDVTLEQFYDGRINLKKNDGRLNIALAGNDFVTIGLGIRSTESQDHITAVYDNETTKMLRTIGSVSIKSMDMFYFGLGFERVSEESSYAVDLTWSNLVGGVGLQLGQPGSTRFRLEYSMASSESVENKLKGDMAASQHPSTTVTRMSAEVMFSGLLFSLLSTESISQVDMIENGEEIDKIKAVDSQGGVLWIPENGLSIGFYFLTNKIESSYDDTNGSFKVKLAYLF